MQSSQCIDLAMNLNQYTENLNDDNTSSFMEKHNKVEDGRESQKLLERILYFDRYIIALGCLAIALSILAFQNEFQYTERTKKDNEAVLKNLLHLIFFVSFIMTIFNFFRNLLLF
jgi:hypothetical protein